MNVKLVLMLLSLMAMMTALVDGSQLKKGSTCKYNRECKSGRCFGNAIGFRQGQCK